MQVCDEYTTWMVTENFPERSAFWSISPETVALSSRNYQTSPDIQRKDEAFDARVSFHWLITFPTVTTSLEMWPSEQDHWPNTGSQCHSGCPSAPWLASSYCSTRPQVFYCSNVTSARLLQIPWIPTSASQMILASTLRQLNAVLCEKSMKAKGSKAGISDS